MNDPASLADLTGIIQNIVTLAIYFAGSAAIVMLIVGGFQFLLAGGDKEATQKSGRTITFAIGGLLLVISSWLIIKTLGTFLGFDLSDFVFKICLPGYDYNATTHSCLR